MTDDIPAGKVEAVARVYCCGARCAYERDGYPCVAVGSHSDRAKALIRAADAWDAEQRAKERAENTFDWPAEERRSVPPVGTINAPKWWAD